MGLEPVDFCSGFLIPSFISSALLNEATIILTKVQERVDGAKAEREADGRAQEKREEKEKQEKEKERKAQEKQEEAERQEKEKKRLAEDKREEAERQEKEKERPAQEKREEDAYEPHLGCGRRVKGLLPPMGQCQLNTIARLIAWLARCPASQAGILMILGTNVLLREDKVPRGAIINQCKLVTIEGIHHFKMILPTVKLRVTRPHRSEICDLVVARYIPGGYDLLLGQDFQSPSKLEQSRGRNPPHCSLGMSKPQTPDFVPLPVPPGELQWPPPPRSTSSHSGTQPCPQCQCHTLHRLIPPGDPTFDSQSLQCHLVPPPEHGPDLHSRDPSPGPLSSPGLALLPMPVRETDPPNHSGSSLKGATSQPLFELVILTCEPLMPATTAATLSQSATDTAVSKGFCHVSNGQLTQGTAMDHSNKLAKL
ncbi:uncharacterized protein [Macrobrachium rosenbergii]|uniref:uncharacterized protein n=1 Tax=Macrobrachium rosenbergii TaxID=79674 RepID=UPI0034D5E286